MVNSIFYIRVELTHLSHYIILIQAMALSRPSPYTFQPEDLPACTATLGVFPEADLTQAGKGGQVLTFGSQPVMGATCVTQPIRSSDSAPWGLPE